MYQKTESLTLEGSPMIGLIEEAKAPAASVVLIGFTTRVVSITIHLSFRVTTSDGILISSADIFPFPIDMAREGNLILFGIGMKGGMANRTGV